MKTAALLLVLAVAASQVEMVRSGFYLVSGEILAFSGCEPIVYGLGYTEAEVLFPEDGSFSFCFLLSSADPQPCFSVSDASGAIQAYQQSPTFLADPTATLHAELPTLTETAVCSTPLSLRDGNEVDYMIIHMHVLGTQAAVVIETTDTYGPDELVVTTMVGDTTLNSWTFDTTADDTFYMDISGCRSLGLIVPPTLDEDKCTTTCPYTNTVGGIRELVTGCSSSEICLGNNECSPFTRVCTLMGSTVIDFFFTAHSVPDLCAYTLVENDETQVSVEFQERHLDDVPYLTNVNVFMKAASITINLGPGGVVQVGEEILELTSTPQTLHGVELSKDDTGVTLKTPATNTAVHFDGDTAHLTGGGSGLTGLCGDPETEFENLFVVGDTYNSVHSASGCDDSQSAEVDITTDCSASDDYCDQMSQASFDDCKVDPLPFITACKSKACKYAEEGRPVGYLACQYLEAYAKACFLALGTTLGDWRSAAGCSATRVASCLNQDCRDHEFCAGEPVCFCRASFDHPRDEFAEPTVCMDGSMEVTLVECLLWENGVDPSALNLIDENCKGVSDPETHKITFSAAGAACGTEVTKEDGSIVYSNAVLMGARPLASLITRDKQVEVDFSCSVTELDFQESVTFRIKAGSVFQKVEDVELSFSLTMTAYTDAEFLSVVPSDAELELNQRIWLVLTTEELDEDSVAVVTDSCWVTNDVDPAATPSYDLVIGGCPNPDDQTVEMVGNGLGVSNSFSFLMFVYTEEHRTSELYLHCNLEVRLKTTPPPNCGVNRKRRSARPGYAAGGHAPPGVWTH